VLVRRLNKNAISSPSPRDTAPLIVPSSVP